MPTKSKNVGAENNQKYYVMHERQGQHCCWLVVRFLRKHHGAMLPSIIWHYNNFFQN